MAPNLYQDQETYPGISGRSGFALLELTTALFIVTVGVFGIIHLHTRGLDKLRVISEYDTALCALNNEIEYLRALPYETLEQGARLPFRSTTPGIERLHRAETFVCIEDAGVGPVSLKRATARIRWTGEHGRGIEKHLVTLIAPKEFGYETK